MTSKLLIQEPPLQVLPSLAVAIGLNEALIIQQLHYWLENPKVGVERDGHKWIFNTYDEWHENFPFWSTSTIQRIFSSLESMGLVISAQLDSKKHDMKKFYRIDYDALCKMDDSKLLSSKTAKRHDVKRTTETTPKTNIDSETNKKIIESANKTVDCILAQAGKAKLSWDGREKIAESLWPLADAFVSLTGLKPAKKELMYWMGEWSDWYNWQAVPEDVKAALEHSRRDPGGFLVSSPGSLSKTVRAIAAKRLAIPAPKQEETTPAPTVPASWLKYYEESPK